MTNREKIIRINDPWCACGNRLSACIGTRRGCRHMSPRCRSITGAVNDDYCDWCRREQALLAELERLSKRVSEMIEKEAPNAD